MLLQGICTSLYVCARHVHPSAQVCQALAPSGIGSSSDENCCCPFWGNALGFLTPQQAPATDCRPAPQICTKGAAWSLPQPHPCTSPTALWGPQGPLRPSPKPSPRALVGLDRTAQAGHILALLGHPDWSIFLKSGSRWLVHPHPPVASQKRIQGRLQEPRLGRVTTIEGQGSQNLPSRNYGAH